MERKEKTYIAIDLKSFYASVECVERSLDPLSTNLVVADKERSEKTICLAVSPSLKRFGIPGRPRLFEVNQKIKKANATRVAKLPNKQFNGSSYDYNHLLTHPECEIDFIVAKPQMAHYIAVSTKIYEIYLKYVASEDIHVYSIDEVFIDITPYLETYKMSAYEIASMMVQDVIQTTGITATVGIGSNLYLAKVAMDIVAKHMQTNKDGILVAQLDEMSYRNLLWNHKPLTDFWRVGKGYAKKLEAKGLYTMGDIARCSLYDEELLYKLFGINAELLIDHAWGWEPCTIKDIKNYKPTNQTLGSGQVFSSPYTFDKAKLVIKEMIDALSLDLVEKKLVTNKLVLTIGYDAENLLNKDIRNKYTGHITSNYYGKEVPKHAHGTANLAFFTSSTQLLTNALISLYNDIVDEHLTIRRVSLSALIMKEDQIKQKTTTQQLDLFSNYDDIKQKQEEEQKLLEREKKQQQALIKIKNKYGKNAVLKANSLLEGATAKERNRQIGGHRK